jgi:tetratricopeptide (TPR) repeat protein
MFATEPQVSPPAETQVRQAKYQADEFLPPPRVDTPKPPSPEGAALLGLARIAVKEGNLTEAIQRFGEYLQRYPNDFAVRQEFAGVLTQSGDRTRAIEEFQKLLAARPGDAEATLGLANVYFQAQQYTEAITLLRTALEKSPNNLAVAARLARAYALDRDFLHAHEIYLHKLASLKPGEARVPRDLTALLLDLQRPTEALMYLQPQREKKPEDGQILVEMARAYAALKDNGAALKIVEDLGKKGRESVADLLDLGKALVSSGDDMVAAVVYGQVLGVDPVNQTAQLGMALVQIHQYLPEPACAALSAIKPTPALCRAWSLVWAEYHQLVGEYEEARQRYVSVLIKDPQDGEARLGLAKLLQFIQEYEKAKAEYAKAPQIGGQGRDARRGIANTLYDQRRYAESIELCEKLLTEDPADGETMARLMRDNIKMGDANQAASMGRGFLVKFSYLEPVLIPVQLALGRALLECGRYADAAREYECLLAKPTGRIPEAWYGLARALAKLNEPIKADQTLVAAYSEPGHEIRNQLQIADLFYADYDDHQTEHLAKVVLKHDPKNLAALIRLADAQLRASRPSGNIDDVVATSKAILALSPTNVRGHLALARAYSVAQNWAASVAQYDQLLSINSLFLIAKVEKARALFSAHRFGASAAAYQSAMQPDPADLLRNGILFFLQSHPESRLALKPCLECGPITPQLVEELKKLAATLGDTTAQGVVRGLLLDVEARATEVTIIHLESDGKSKRDWRNFTAKPIYQKLVTMQPDNLIAFFDLGQVDGELRQTHNAMNAFGQVLAIDPLNRESAIALERAGLELNPNVTLFEHAFTQFGRNGLTNDTRFRTGALFNYPIGDENEMLGIGYTNLFYNLPGFASLPGNALVLNAAKRADDRLLFYGLVNIEEYANRISTRPTYDIGTRWVVCDGTTLTASTFLNNVIENGESVQQNIYRYGFFLGSESWLNRFWTAGGYYRFTYYSDINVFSEIFANTAVVATLPPNLLKFVTLIDYWTYTKQTVFGPDGSIVGALHPYFAPAGFTYIEGRAEYTHWFSRDYFVYSNQCYLTLQYGLAFDNTAHIYDNLHAILNWDVKPWLSTGFRADAQLATVYKMEQIFAYLVFRMPSRP